MIAPTVLDATSTAIGRMFGQVPDWYGDVGRNLAGTDLCRMVGAGDLREHVMLATLLCIRDEVGLIVEGHPALLGLVEATAANVGATVDLMPMGSVVHCRFDTEGVTS